jgi:AraC family transcriptional regulator, arabinose operon regulatory protein
MNTYINPLLTEEVNLPFYVKCIGGLKNQGHIIRPSGFPDHQWLHCIKGRGKLLIDNKEFNIVPNTGFFISANFPHEYYSVEEPWEVHFIAFTGHSVLELLDLLDLNNYGVFLFEDIGFLDSLLSDVYTAARAGTIQGGYRSSAALYSLLIEIKNSIRENSSSIENSRFKKLQPLINYIEKNYYKDISIEDMAEIILSSPQYLCRLFNQTFNMRPFTYLTRYRLQKAKEMLVYNKDLTVGEIAAGVGYKDQSYFCAIFKKNEGMTPLEYRNIYKL